MPARPSPACWVPSAPCSSKTCPQAQCLQPPCPLDKGVFIDGMPRSRPTGPGVCRRGDTLGAIPSPPHAWTRKSCCLNRPPPRLEPSRLYWPFPVPTQWESPAWVIRLCGPHWRGDRISRCGACSPTAAIRPIATGNQGLNSLASRSAGSLMRRYCLIYWRPSGFPPGAASGAIAIRSCLVAAPCSPPIPNPWPPF